MTQSSHVPTGERRLLGDALKYLDLSMLNVMVADDNRHIRDIIVQILRALGVRNLHMAEDGVAAFQILCAQPIDIVIIDNRMQPISGNIHIFDG